MSSATGVGYQKWGLLKGRWLLAPGCFLSINPVGGDHYTHHHGGGGSRVEWFLKKDKNRPSASCANWFLDPKSKISLLHFFKFYLNFKFSLWWLFFWVKGLYLQICKVRVIFWEWNFASCALYVPAANLTIFPNLIYKNMPDRQHVARFLKSQEVLFHSTLLRMKEKGGHGGIQCTCENWLFFWHKCQSWRIRIFIRIRTQHFAK